MANINKIPAKPTGRNRSRFTWWRRFRPHKYLPTRRGLLARIKNGDFEFSFVVPKDISYNIGNGKLSLYATALESDASGYNRNVLIGGYNENSQLDNEGPEIELYLNDENST